VVKIAIVGCGRFAERHHLRQYSSLADRVQLVAFVDPDQDRTRMFRKAAGSGQAYHDVSELPNPDQIDYVDVCVPHRFHLPVGLALLEAGHNVLLEKPMAPSTAECDELIGAADANRLRLGVGMHTRFHPSWAAVREFIQSGKAGRPLCASGAFNSNLASFHEGGGAVSPWRSSTEGGGGAVLDLGIYLADIFLWTFGDPVLVQAMRVANSPSDPPGGRRGSEMTGVVTAELEAGVIVSFQATWDHPKVKLPPGANGGGMSCTIVCEGGVLLAPDQAQEHPAVFYPSGQKAPVLLEMPEIKPELSQVVSSVENGEEFPVTGREGRRSVAFVEAALDSIATRTGVVPH